MSDLLIVFPAAWRAGERGDIGAAPHLGRRAAPSMGWIRTPAGAIGSSRSGRLDRQDLELEPAARRVDLRNLAAPKTEDRPSERRGDRDPADGGVRLERADELELEPRTGFEIAHTHALAHIDASVPRLRLDDLRGLQPLGEQRDPSLEQRLVLADSEVLGIFGTVRLAGRGVPESLSDLAAPLVRQAL